MRGKPLFQEVDEQAHFARPGIAVGTAPTRAAGLPDIFRKAIAAVEHGAVAVVDVRVKPGYAPPMTAAMTRQAD